MHLYKYTTAPVAILILETLRVRFTQSLAFNDPYDSIPLLTPPYTEQQIDNLFHKMITDKDKMGEVLD